MISEIHILPEIIYNENRRNGARGIQKNILIFFGKLHYKCEVLWEMMTCKSYSEFHIFFLLFFYGTKTRARRHPVIVAILLLYMVKTLNPNDKSHRNIFKFFFCWTYFGADFFYVYWKEMKWTTHFPFSCVFHL